MAPLPRRPILRPAVAVVMLCASIVPAFSLRVAAATPSSPVSEDVPIIGGTAALAVSLGLDAVPDRARFVTELTRIFYDTPEGKNATTDALLQRLTAHLD